MQDRIIDSKHNNPPSDEDVLSERLKTDYAREIKAVESLEKREIPEKIEDDEAAGGLSDFRDELKKTKKSIEDAHKKEKDTFMKRGRVVDGFKNTWIAKIDAVLTKSNAPLDKYLAWKEDQERIRLMEKAAAERREADALLEEAAVYEREGIQETAEELMDHVFDSETKANRIEAYVQEAKPSTLARVRGSMGSVTSRKKAWVGEIENIAIVDLEVLRKYFTEDSIQKAINAFVRDGGRKCSGVKIEEKSSIR